MKNLKDLKEYFKQKEGVLKLISNINKVKERAKKFYGPDAEILISPNKKKKYRILNPNTNRYIDFGGYPYEDYQKHGSEEHRLRYLKRATNIKGNWSDPYSPNMLSIRLLWNGDI
jgi:hypothetical protein